MQLQEVFSLLAHPADLLAEVTLEQLLRLIVLSSPLKQDIIISQPPNHDPSIPPALLAPHHRLFLAKVCEIDLRFIDQCWVAV
ncbi:hypothetical protein BT96DRAFT_816188 [Gymnopus androsaceus JB14]|uniref:Uncharacterized protein n=1 Tax=Gymnopus androsaceus JB14 TaxID=1447944 RepID=A0A6A4I1J6_9AGAR|nr:hypothetical protein BT96DRAFT_816188 [Gymnopus androsaceus JB14]